MAMTRCGSGWMWKWWLVLIVGEERERVRKKERDGEEEREIENEMNKNWIVFGWDVKNKNWDVGWVVKWYCKIDKVVFKMVNWDIF